MLAENHFLAARDGVRAQLIDPATARRPAGDALADLLEACWPYVAALGCMPELVASTALAADPGDARQCRLATRDGLTALPAWLANQYAPARPAVGAT